MGAEAAPVKEMDARLEENRMEEAVIEDGSAQIRDLELTMVSFRKYLNCE